MNTLPHYLSDDPALASFLAGFEAPSLAGKEWTHAAHVAMAAVYLRRYGSDVLAPTRAAIQRFNTSVGGPPTAYHETLTVLWLAIVAGALEDAGCDDDLCAATHAVRLYGADSKAHARFYSYDVVKDDVARAQWVAPDLIAVEISFLLPGY
jgi:hypothetical protein